MKILKIVYWGMAGSGKTTIVDTLHKIMSERKMAIQPIGALTKIARDDGSTLYFDRGVFQSSNGDQKYNVQTVAGQKSFFPLRKRVFEKTDGVILVVDSRTNFFEDNIESLKELKHVAVGGLITKIPLIIMLNKQDLREIIGVEDFKQILKEEKLWYEPDDKMSIWNPIIYQTCALYAKERDLFRSFSECARRTRIYQAYGDGKAPTDYKEEGN